MSDNIEKRVRIVTRKETHTRIVTRAYIQLPKSLIEEIEREIKSFIGIENIGKLKLISIRTNKNVGCTLYVEAIEDMHSETG